jgi:hypothetical protein
MKDKPIIHIVRDIIPMKVGGDFSLKELLDLGKYDYIYYKHDWKNLEVPRREEKEVTAWRFTFNNEHYPEEIVDHVLTKFNRLERPSWDDVLYFGKMFPGKFWKQPQMFLHEPFLRHYFVLSGSSLSVSEDKSGRPFHKDCAFIFIGPALSS